MTQQQDVEPMAALAATYAAMAEAARHAGGGVRTAGRRAARNGTDLGRRAVASAVDSGHRANVAFRVYRGDQHIYQRRPSEYVAMGVVAGLTAAFAIAALGRALLRRPDEGPGGKRVPLRLDRVREVAAGVARRRPVVAPVPPVDDQPAPVQQRREEHHAGETSGVTTIHASHPSGAGAGERRR